VTSVSRLSSACSNRDSTNPNNPAWRRQTYSIDGRYMSIFLFSTDVKLPRRFGISRDRFGSARHSLPAVIYRGDGNSRRRLAEIRRFSCKCPGLRVPFNGHERTEERLRPGHFLISRLRARPETCWGFNS